MDGKLICLLCFICVIDQPSTGDKQGNKQDDFESSDSEEVIANREKATQYGFMNEKQRNDKISGSIQMGIEVSMSYTVDGPECDLVKSDFLNVDVVKFPQNGTTTRKHKHPEFTFKTYAPLVYHRFREVYGIEHDEYKRSFLSPLRVLSNPGASGSLFYITHDDEFIIKSAQKNESRFLKKLLTGYYWNLKQNPKTLLPKFYGHYRYQSDSIMSFDSSTRSFKSEIIDIRLVTMNNLLPSDIEMHEKYDLKGSSYNRKASENERSKKEPTYKDIDFIERHPDGFYLNPDTYDKLVDLLERDCKVLESFRIMDYSLLIGVHEVNETQEYSGEYLGENEYQPEEQSSYAAEKDALPIRGIRALNGKGQRLLLFVGIIDVLQRFNFKKKIEHTLKTIRHKREEISVNKPGFYATRFLEFLTKKVFKVGLFPENQLLSPFEDDTPAIDSLHTGEEKSSDEGFAGEENDHLQPTQIDKRLGHRRVGDNGVVTSKQNDSYNIMRSVQMGIKHELKNFSNAKRDIVVPDFALTKAIVFPPGGTNDTPPHGFPEFTFKSYAPSIYRRFRKAYKIKSIDYMKSFCDSPLRELSNPGASGSIFYITNDDKYIMKSVQQQESRFLKKLLPWYFMNFYENQNTLLPKFFGHYRYQCISNNSWTASISGRTKNNLRLIVMNNLIPSNVDIHEKYDLKGSTHNRKASENEKKKNKPTYKDLDFKEKHPDGFFLEPNAYVELLDTLKRDSRVLQSYRIMDYSLLIGVQRLTVDQSTEKEPVAQGSRNVEDKINDGSGSETQSPDAVNKPMKGIPATDVNGQKIVLFVGIIDVLQDYRLKKRIEHKLKSIIHDGNTISVHRPEIYASRFLNFMEKFVFKKLLGPLNRSSTFVETRSCKINYQREQEWLQEIVLPWEQ